MNEPSGQIIVDDRAAPRRLRIGRLLLAVLLAAVPVLALLVPARSDAGDGLPKVFHVAFSARVFSDVDQSDAQIAMELWARELSRKIGIPQARVTIFKDATEIAEQVRSGDIHMVILPAMEYISQRKKLNIVPAYVAENKSGRDMESLLIVRRDSGIKTPRDLKGKTLATLPAAKNEAGFVWLNALLGRETGRPASKYLGTIHTSPKPSQAVMGVFFRQFGGAVVTRGSYETCKVLNPQLERDLTVIAASKNLLSEITCLSTTLSPRLRQAVDSSVLTMHETSAGRQMVTLFQIDRVIPFRPDCLTGLEELLRERERLTSRKVKR
jgi:ABC-type phosphate/phosphonate transport system substrate-binding protein